MIVEGLPSLEEIASNLDKQTGTSKEKSNPEVPPPTKVEEKATGAATEEKTDATPAPAPETKPEPPKKPDPQAARFAALTRREKELRTMQAQIEARQKEIDDRLKAADEREARLKAAKRPTDALKELGFTHADAMADVLGQYKEPEPDPVEQKLKEKLTPYEQKLQEVEATNKKLQEALDRYEADRVEVAKREVQSNIREAVKRNGCELIETVGEQGYILVQDVMQEYWQTNKRVLTYDEACAKVEAYYLEQAKKLAATSKVRSGLAPSDPPPPAPSEQTSTPSAKPKSPPATLTQTHTPASRAMPDLDKMPKHEALEWLAANAIKYRAD